MRAPRWLRRILRRPDPVQWVAWCSAHPRKPGHMMATQDPALPVIGVRIHPSATCGCGAPVEGPAVVIDPQSDTPGITFRLT